MATEKFVVEATTYWEIDGKIHELKRQLRQKGGSPLDPAKVNFALQRIIEGDVGDHTAVPASAAKTRLVHGLFVSPDEQVANVRYWNEQRGWGFEKEAFERLGPSPGWPDENLVAVVLVPYLDTVQRTFDELWAVAASRQPNARLWWDQLRSDAEHLHLRLLEGITHVSGLRWEIIDLGAHWDRENGIAPHAVRDAKTSPHAGILAAAAHFPTWVQEMDGTKVPYVWIPGYEASVPGPDPCRVVPYVDWDVIHRWVRLYARWGGSRHPRFAVPVRRGK